MRPQLLIAAAVWAAVTGCSGSGSNDNPSIPDCAAVWTAGGKVPEHYHGCIRPDGDIEAGIKYSCAGNSRLVIYGGDTWGWEGGPVRQMGSVPLEDQPGYRKAYASC